MTNSTAAINIERHNSDGSNEHDMSYVGSYPFQVGTSYVDIVQHITNEQFNGVSLEEQMVAYNNTASIESNSEMTSSTATTTTTPNLLSPEIKLLELEKDFPLLPGEVKINVIEKKEICIVDGGTLMLTNYRLLYLKNSLPQAVSIFTLMELELTDYRDPHQVVISMKGGRVQRFSFMTEEEAVAWHKQLTRIVTRLNRGHSIVANGGTSSTQNEAFKTDETRIENNEMIDVFAWHFSKAVDEKPNSYPWLKSEKSITPDIAKVDFDRLGMKTSFKLTDVNLNFELCETYPEKVIVPIGIENDELIESADHRGLKRFPVVVWRSPVTKAVLLRSAQPRVGIFGWPKPGDAKIIELVTNIAARESGERKQFIILDARTYAAAFANRARSGGFENTEYYQKAKLEFLGLPNIHAVRNSFIAIRNLLQNVRETDALANLQNTGWLQNLNNLLLSSFTCANYLSNGHSVLVHCSDGWDRTTQIVSLAKLVVDKYYRTIKGFEELIRREWLAFGHKFYDRQQSFNGNWDAGERSPIFLQFLEAVRHLQKNQSTAFEFSHAYLVKLAQHAYSGLFGTFLFNSQKEMNAALESRNGTLVEIWRFLGSHNEEFVNQCYDDKLEVNLMEINCSVLNLQTWNEVYSENNKNIDISQPIQNGHNAPISTLTMTPSKESSCGSGISERPSSGCGISTNTTNGSNGTLMKSKSSESISSINIESAPVASIHCGGGGGSASNGTCHSAENGGCFNSLTPCDLTASMYQTVPKLTTAISKEEVLKLIDNDGLLRFVDREQEVMRTKNKENQLKEMRNQRICSERSRPSGSSDGYNDRTRSLCEEVGHDGPIDRADSDMSLINENEYSTFPIGTTWETSSGNCALCKKQFVKYSVYSEDRKHHCRNCGKVVCDDCSKNRYHSVELGGGKQQRACNNCYQGMKQSSQLSESQEEEEMKRAGSLNNIEHDAGSFGSSVSYVPSTSPSSISLNIPPSQPQAIHSSCKSSNQSMSSPRPSPGEFSRHGSSQAVKG